MKRAAFAARYVTFSVFSCILLALWEADFLIMAYEIQLYILFHDKISGIDEYCVRELGLVSGFLS